MLELETVSGISASAAALPSELAEAALLYQTVFALSQNRLKICQGNNALWIVVTRPDAGGFALRAASSLDSSLTFQSGEETATGYQATFDSALGMFQVELQISDSEQTLLRCTTRLTPAVPLLLPPCPRDLYPLDEQGNPVGTQGSIHAAQRGHNAPIIYLTLAEPKFGSVLYYQNLTALNPYFLTTETKPDGAVGGQWSELGFALPTSKDKPLPEGKEITLADTFVSWNAVVPENNQDAAHDFLDLLATIYRVIDRPPTQYRDWLTKAEETLHDLQTSPKATVKHYGHTYLRPYTDAEVPDSMVQMTVQMPIREFAEWKSEAIPFVDELWKGMPRFYDSELKIVRRYLPNVGKDKNANEVDSWYLYHPLTNLARLAKSGNKQAETLFCNSLDFAIKVARHFKYDFPIMFDIETLAVIKEERKEGEPGQSDVGGIYAYVMLQAWDLTQHKRYLEEARKAIDKICDVGFETLYQSNLTAWGVNACLRLWHITREEHCRKQSDIFLANFFHNTVLWESELGTAKDYHNIYGRGVPARRSLYGTL